VLLDVLVDIKIVRNEKQIAMANSEVKNKVLDYAEDLGYKGADIAESVFFPKMVIPSREKGYPSLMVITTRVFGKGHNGFKDGLDDNIKDIRCEMDVKFLPLSVFWPCTWESTNSTTSTGIVSLTEDQIPSENQEIGRDL
jgi:hypothetical protein